MKHARKLASLLLALVMVFALSATAFAATVTKTPEDLTGLASITVDLPAVPSGATAKNEYKIYKVFDATLSSDYKISYTLVAGKTDAPAGFTVDANGYVTYSGSDTELTSSDITAIKGYVTNSMLVATIETTQADKSFTVAGLPYGYYYITTTTGSVVTVNSTMPNASVRDKNTVPSLDKTIKGATGTIDATGKKAIARVGTDVTYTATITVGTGAENYVFHDKMGTGLSYNNDLVVKAGGNVVDISKYETTPVADGDTLTVTFKNDYISTLEVGTTITLTYTAKITNAALTVNPEKNTAYLDYGHTPGDNSTPKKETEVFSAKITVYKQDSESKPLAGAGFVLRNADGKYYKFTEATENTPAKVEWVTVTGKLEEAITGGTITEHVSAVANNQAVVGPFQGLSDGTYTLVESTVPAGYTKATDTTVTINGSDYTATNLEQTKTIENKAGTLLPSTGGMGTTIFYVLGSILAVGAIVLLVTKKRMSAAD